MMIICVTIIAYDSLWNEKINIILIVISLCCFSALADRCMNLLGGAEFSQNFIG